LKLQLLARRSDIKSGDAVVTAGTGGLFPPGYQIGVIVGVAEDPNFVLDEASLEPSVDFGALDEVFVVTGRKQVTKRAP
jgi:rod shape-determining protein MreC